MQPPKVIEPPDNEWVTRLRHNHIVFAPKENKYYMVDFAYEPPDIGRYCTGRMGLIPLWFSEDGWGSENDGWRYHTWHIKPDGRGFDGSYILLPCEGHLPEEPPKMSEPWVRQIERRLAIMESKIDGLEAAAHTHIELDDLKGW